MASKKELNKLLGGDDEPKKPVIRRGQGLKLSTENQETAAPEPPVEKAIEPPEETATEVPADLSDQIPTEIEIAPFETTQKRYNAATQYRTSAKSQKSAAKSNKSMADLPVKHKRVNRGYKLREDLIKACKRIALEEDRKLYEVMEEALAFYLAEKLKT